MAGRAWDKDLKRPCAIRIQRMKMDTDSAAKAMPYEKARLPWLAWQFLKIGTIGFGGGVAVIALMRQECVNRRQCLSDEEFLHGVSLGQFLGSFAVNTAFFVGYRLRGLLGGLVALTCFLAPSVTMVMLLSWFYASARDATVLQLAMKGVRPVVIAVIVRAATGLAKGALRSWLSWGLGLLGLIGALLHWQLLLLLGVGGIAGVISHTWGRKEPVSSESSDNAGSQSGGASRLSLFAVTPLDTTGTAVVAGAKKAMAAGGTVGLASLTLLFLKIGFVFFGGGYVLVPLLQQELVIKRHLLTMPEFLNGVAISQLTPGPIAVLATFAGFHLCGVTGALLATVALYTPATLLMAILCSAYSRLRNLAIVQAVLAHLGPVIVGMILASAIQLLPHSSMSFSHPLGMILAGAAYGGLLRGWHPAVLLGAGALLGVIIPTAFV